MQIDEIALSGKAKLCTTKSEREAIVFEGALTIPEAVAWFGIG
jgi:hypothetical protein